MLIPTDPTEAPNGTIDTRSKIRCDLREFFEDWNKVELEKQKHIEIAHELSEMLDRGLFRCAPENVFKVITTLKVDYLLKGLTKDTLQESFDKGPEEEAKVMDQLPPILGSMTANLISIWNNQISPQEFQYFPEPL